VCWSPISLAVNPFEKVDGTDDHYRKKTLEGWEQNFACGGFGLFDIFLMQENKEKLIDAI